MTYLFVYLHRTGLNGNDIPPSCDDDEIKEAHDPPRDGSPELVGSPVPSSSEYSPEIPLSNAPREHQPPSGVTEGYKL